MNIFSVDLTVPEIHLLRQSLDVITITGKDAKFLANLQTKLESELQSINSMISQEEVKKQKELEAFSAAENRKAAKEGKITQ